MNILYITIEYKSHVFFYLQYSRIIEDRNRFLSRRCQSLLSDLIFFKAIPRPEFFICYLQIDDLHKKAATIIIMGNLRLAKKSFLR